MIDENVWKCGRKVIKESEGKQRNCYEVCQGDEERQMRWEKRDEQRNGQELRLQAKMKEGKWKKKKCIVNKWIWKRMRERKIENIK